VWFLRNNTFLNSIVFLKFHRLYSNAARYLSQYSVWLRSGRTSFDPGQGQRIFPLTSASRLALGPTQPPIQWVPGALFLGVKCGWGVMLTIHPLLVPRLRKSRSYTSSHPNAPVWSITGPLYFFYLYIQMRW
jgi:hypothetical protein